MRVAYIAGPYRASTIAGVVANIRAAEAVAAKYWRLGYAVHCPHKNSGLMDGICSDDVWLNGGLEILRRCDTIVMMENYIDSEGSVDELEVARLQGLEVIFEGEVTEI